MKNSVITDTGFWYALIDENDQFHLQAEQALKVINVPLITTWAVMTETCYLLQSRMSQREAVQFLNCYQQKLYEIYTIAPDKIARLATLMDKYANLPMDLADASLVLLAEELGHGRILSTDRRDFGAYRWKNHYPFENILLGE